MVSSFLQLQRGTIYRLPDAKILVDVFAMSSVDTLMPILQHKPIELAIVEQTICRTGTCQFTRPLTAVHVQIWSRFSV